MSISGRVALFSVTYDPFVGGAEIALKEVTKGLQSLDFDLYTALLDRSLPRTQKVGNMTIFRLGSGSFLDKYLYPFRAAREAYKNHQKQPYQAIHAYLATYAGLAAMLFKRRVKIPYILTMQSGDSDRFLRLRTWFWHPWYKQIYTSADMITAISSWLAARARRYGYKKEIAIIPNGAALKRFSEPIDPEARITLRNSWGAEDTDTVILTVSRLVHKNGVDILIDAMSDVGDNAVLIIAGDGKDRAKLASLAKKKGKRIRFAGEVDHDTLPQYYHASNIFARPSRTEGFGNVFIEAMAAGLPVVATPVGGIVDFIHDNENGLLAQSEDAKSVAKKINMLVQNERLRSDFSARGKETAAAYSWDCIVEQYGNVYKEVLS